MKTVTYSDICCITGVLCGLDNPSRMHGISSIQSMNLAPSLHTLSRAHMVDIGCGCVVSGCQSCYNLLKKWRLGACGRLGWEKYASRVYSITQTYVSLQTLCDLKCNVHLGCVNNCPERGLARSESWSCKSYNTWTWVRCASSITCLLIDVYGWHWLLMAGWREPQKCSIGNAQDVQTGPVASIESAIWRSAWIVIGQVAIRVGSCW